MCGSSTDAAKDHGGKYTAAPWLATSLESVRTRPCLAIGGGKVCTRILSTIPQCAIVNTSGRVSRPILHPIPVQRVFQILGIDVMDLPKTCSKWEQTCGPGVFQDFPSKYLLVFPIPDQNAIGIANRKWCHCLGCQKPYCQRGGQTRCLYLLDCNMDWTREWTTGLEY